MTASLSGKERCWSAVPVCREGSKTEVRSENLSVPLLAMDSAGAEMEPGNVSTRAAPVESAQGPDPSGSQPGSLSSAEPQFRQFQEITGRHAKPDADELDAKTSNARLVQCGAFTRLRLCSEAGGTLACTWSSRSSLVRSADSRLAMAGAPRG